MVKCPSCSALLYSRTSGICPECKSPLPQDLQLSQEEKQNRKFEGERLRQMAADMQEKSKKKGLIRRFL
jgi:predicted amidophosphoribosyltransferase